jgi:hypothetical protein
MKKIMLGLLVLFLVGCNVQPTAKTVVEQVLNQLKTNPTALNDQVLSAESLVIYQGSIANFGMTVDSQEDPDGYAQKIADVMNSTIKDFTFTIDRVQEENDKALVTVTFTTHPIGKVFVASLSEAFTYYFNNQDNTSTDDMNVKLLELVTKKFNESKRDMRSTVDIKVQKIDGKWKMVLVDEDEFFDAWLGGMYSEIKGFQLDPGLNP